MEYLDSERTRHHIEKLDGILRREKRKSPGNDIAAWTVVAVGSVLVAGILNPGLIPVALKAVTVGAKLTGAGLAVKTAWGWTSSKGKGDQG